MVFKANKLYLHQRMKNSHKTLLITLTLGILTAIGSISIDIYLPAFEVMATYFKVPIVRIETTVTVFLLGMAFGQLFIGPFSDVYGRKLPLRAGLIIYIICSICCMLTGSFLLFLLFRFIQGLAGSACQVISRSLVNDIYGDRSAAHVFTILQILMGISPILAPMIGGMLAEADTWKLLFLIMASISGLGLLGCFTILPAGRIPEPGKRLNISGIRSAYTYCIQHPSFVNYALLRAISNSAAFSFVTASPFVFIQLYKLSKQQYGFIFSGLALSIICAGIINTRLLKHYEVKTITKAAIVIQLFSGLLAVLTLYFNGSIYLLVAIIGLFFSMLGVILPNSTALYLKGVASSSGAGSALVGTMSYLSAFLITSLLSLLHNNTAYPMFLMMWACSILAFLCMRYKRAA